MIWYLSWKTVAKVALSIFQFQLIAIVLSKTREKVDGTAVILSDFSRIMSNYCDKVLQRLLLNNPCAALTF